MIRYLFELVLDIPRGIAAAAIACLPKRLWQRFDDLPVHLALMPSALGTLLAGAAIQIVNYFHEIRAYSLAVANATWEVATRQAQHGGPWARRLPGDITTMDSQAAMLPSAFFIALGTPWGLLATYLTISAAIRVAAWAANDPIGDPLLTGLDALWRWDRRRAKRYRQEGRRRRLEGREVADRLMRGVIAGLDAVDYVVIASRRKPGWTAGAIVMTPDGWFRLGEPFDVTLREGLRTAYPLSAMDAVEVVRRGVTYELPPIDPALRLPQRAPDQKSIR